MSELEVISLKVDRSLLMELKAAIGDSGMSEFIRRAIKKALGLLDESSKEFTNMAKKVETLNTKPTEQKVADIEIKIQIIFEELQRQNEILTLIHRRTSFAANFALHGLDELKKSTSFSYEERQKLVEITESEIKQSGIQFLRK